MADENLPRDLQDVLERMIEPAFKLLDPKMTSDEARVELMTIGRQESGFKHRRQMNNGPAMGFWQFEEGGAVKGVMTHPATQPYAAIVCNNLGVPFKKHDVWLALEHNDVLAAAFARLNLWWVPDPLPDTKDADAGWALYIEAWRPGKPHRDTWDAYHAEARDAISL